MIYRVRSILQKGYKRVKKLRDLVIQTAFNRKETVVESRAEWAQVQAHYAPIEGSEGIALRQQHYARYFQRYGRDVRIDAGCFFSSPERIILDDGTRINRGGIFEASSAIRIGRNSRIGHRCFVHSANHDTYGDKETAFFERGYSYLPVTIGDNVLISANVSLMPGLNLGSGSFVAANTVVPRKAFGQASYLSGLPARPFEAKTQGHAINTLVPEPAVAILVAQRGSAREAAAQLLRSVVGMPQIMVAAVGEPLPKSVKAIVCFEKLGTVPAGLDEVWRPSEADGLIQDIISGSDAHPRPEPLRRDRIEYLTAVNGFNEKPGLINTTQATVFMTSNAFLKGTAAMRKDAHSAWCLCLLVASLSPTKNDPRWDLLFDRIGSLVGAEVTGENWRSSSSLAEQSLAKAFEKLVIFAPRLAQLFKVPNVDLARSLSTVLFENSWVIPYLAFRSGATHKEQCRQILDLLAEDATTSPLKSCVGIAYLFLGDESVADEISDELLSPQSCQPNSALVRLAPGETAIDRQPPLVALLSERFMRQTSNDELPVLPPVGVRDLEWRVFAKEVGAIGNEVESLLLAPILSAYSTSLIENWLALQEVPKIDKGHFYLDDSNYHRTCEALDRCWAKLFEHVLERIGVTALRMKPWPAGYDYAISVRYDVDRDISAKMARNIVRIQRESLNSACGSWYFIANAPHNASVKNYIKDWNQEYAHHSCLSSEPEAEDVGVTAHSAGTSEYWRGRQTVVGLEESKAAYGEAMLSAFALPRPGWLGDKRTSVWLTPLHFPLEGSTKDTSTQYFDIRRKQFNAQIENGGLVIIGSHPDCQQRILEDVLARIDTTRAWPVPVRMAVDRVRAIFEPDNITVLTDTEAPGSFYLSSQNTLADVVVEYRHPTADADWQKVVVQLQGDRPRKLDLAVREEPQHT